MDIKSKFADTSNYTRGRNSPVKYIVIHFTANNGDTAKGNCNYFQGADRNASAHYFADENEIYQSVKDSDTAWHCGAKKYYHLYCRNNNSIGVELCSRIDNKGKYYFKNETVNNAVKLVKHLMKKYNITIDRIVRHYDVTHKICPAPFVNDISAWEDFKNRLIGNNSVTNNVDNIKEKNDEMIEKIKLNVNGKEYDVNRILKDGKNFICLSDMKQAGFDVGYDERTKVPSFGVSVSKDSMIVEGKDTIVRKILKADENYVRLRDLENIIDINYNEKTKQVVINSKQLR